MRRVGDELAQLALAALLGRECRALALEGCLDLVEHHVEGVTETAHLGAVVGHADALAQIPVADPLGGGGHLLERSQVAPDHEPAHADDDGQHGQADKQQVARQHVYRLLDACQWRSKDDRHRLQADPIGAGSRAGRGASALGS